MMLDQKDRKPFPDHLKREVYAVVKQEGLEKEKFVRCGIGFVNRDESITLMLDTMPVGGKLQVRRWESREEKEARLAKKYGEAPRERERERGFSAPTAEQVPF